jgi:non-ribosomal peptide synthetase component F
MLSEDAAMVVGLASTAIPFADSPDAEAERWLRILRLHGRAARTLTALGIGEAPLTGVAEPTANGRADSPPPHSDSDVIHRVNEQAAQVAADRGTATVGTADVLLAVMDVYGPDFDRVLGAYGTSRDEVIGCLATGSPTSKH